MKFFVLATLAAVLVTSDTAKPRSINVALDTVFEFEKTSDVDFLNKVQGFLSKVKEIIEDNPKQNEPTRRHKQYKFTDFLEDVIMTLKPFTDKDLKDIVDVVDAEVRKRVLHDVLKNNIRRFLSNKSGRKKSARKVINNLYNLLRKLQYSEASKDKSFLKFINSLYKRDSEEKFAKFIRKLKIFRRSSYRERKGLKDTVRKAIKLIIFDHFSSLKEGIKNETEYQIKNYLRDILPRKNDIYLRGSEKSDKIKLESESFPAETEELELTTKETTKKGNIVNTIEPVNKKIILKKIKLGRTKLSKPRNKNTNAKYPKKKLTHVTLYPESFELEQKRVGAYFRATDPGSLKNNDELRDINDDKTVEDILSLSHSAEIGVNIKHNDINNDKRDYINYAIKKVRDFSQKPKRSSQNVYKVQKPKYLKVKNKEPLWISKTSNEYFGNLYRSKLHNQGGENGSNKYEIIETEKNTHKYSDIKQKITKSFSAVHVKNDTKGYEPKTENKFNKNAEVNAIANEIDDVAKKKGYRRAEVLNNIKDGFMWLNSETNNSKTFTFNHTSTNYISNIKPNSVSITRKVFPITDNITTEKAKCQDIIKEREDLNKINNTNNLIIVQRSKLQNLTKIVTDINKQPIEKQKVTTLANKDELMREVSKTENPESWTTHSFPFTFDIKKYLQESAVKDIENIEKKREIEKKMKEDMDNLFAIPSTNATTTEAYTDIFEALDDAFDLTPLN